MLLCHSKSPLNWRQTCPGLLTAHCCLPCGQAPHTLWSARRTHSSHHHHHHLTSLPGVYYWLQLEHLQSLRPHSIEVVLTKSPLHKAEAAHHCLTLVQFSTWRNGSGQLHIRCVRRSLSCSLSLRLNDHREHIANPISSTFYQAALFCCPWPLTPKMTVISSGEAPVWTTSPF